MAPNPIPALMRLFTPELGKEAARRFGMDDRSLTELDGTAFVFEGLRAGGPAILKITPALAEPCGVMGATRAELEAEVDLIRHLADHGVPVALSLPSVAGLDVEDIPAEDGATFLAYCFQKAPGDMFPDDDLTVFPDGVIREWGRLFGMMHRLGASYRPRPGAFRRDWRANDLLYSRELVPAEQAAVHGRFAQALAVLEGKPRDASTYGIVHGDFHHGNFLAQGELITVIDFDAAQYGWFSMDLATALFNCLPMPRSLEAARREYALHFLSTLMEGYRGEFRPAPSIVRDLPEFLFLNELLAYSYRYKYWEPDELLRRADYLASIRSRIEAGTPVVRFSPSDLDALESVARGG